MSVKFGVHSLVFSDRWDGESAPAICRRAAEMGYELIEVLMFDPATLNREATRRAIAESGLGLRLGMALGPAADISSDDPETARRGKETVALALEIASELGAPAVSGITYAAFNNYVAPQTERQVEQVAEALGRLDIRAGELGVRLGVEPVNRYESYMVNTLDQAAALIGKAGGKNMFVHMDTFHMNIEESDIAAAILRNAPMLGYAHVADSHRGVLGTGNFDLDGYFRALAAIGYAGDLTFEGFSSRMLGPGLVGGVRLWREAWADSAETARLALEAMRTGWKTAHAATRAA
ncbi:sugar phosphate isomerase/epimerase family protein [Chelativorans sp. AA-79]|uniref:sugar phosphate isomerase/epimerase family protein n=1 Tax=Chelativorans sp. AA-79 TaxID=3028735 RepID=UPI0023F64472|nr:sugar phosphate isomerase/epimerase family protein [Chelativorans sp. AA-79]WEX08974.1 sugar phosphate isomerase/epimerase [Chelativorans sp. AA-79]